jgi:WD40 repeat protein
MLGHTNFVWSILLLPDDVTLFSGGLDKVIRMWDIFTGQLIRLMPAEHTSHVTGLALFSAGIIVSSSNDETIKFWDYKAGGCIHTLEGTKTPISTFLVTDDNAILSVGQDKHIYVWD